MEEKLTQREKAGLLGSVDNTNPEDYDRQFYEAMNETPVPHVEELDDRVRRAILRYIASGKGESSKADNGAFVLMGFIHGYQVGRKLKKNITR